MGTHDDDGDACITGKKKGITSKRDKYPSKDVSNEGENDFGLYTCKPTLRRGNGYGG